MHRYTGPFGTLLVALVLAFSVAAGAAQAQPRPELSAETLIEAARAALAEDKLDDAEFLLDGVRPGEGDIDDLDFLHGTIAAKRGEWQEAIRRFRAMIARNPDLPRVRLDLALAYFQAGEDGNAARHFRLALGTKDLPPVVRARALAFLDSSSGGARAGRSPGRWRSCRTATSTPRPAPGRSSCSACRRRCRRMRARPAASG